MKWLWIALAVFVLASIAIALLRRSAGAPIDAWPFYARRLLSTPEQVLYHRLVRALPEHIVLAQVQVSRVLGVKRGFDFHQWNNRINRLSYDFVVCAKDAAVLAAIELDDRSHESSARQRTDIKKERATSAAGILLIRWHVKSLPDADAIRAAIPAASKAKLQPAQHSNRVDPTFAQSVPISPEGEATEPLPLR